MAEGFSLIRAWRRLSIKYKIVIISASLITLRLFLNGNYFIGYQKLEAYHEFEHHVHAASTNIYNFKSSFTEIFFTNGALPQINQSRLHLDKTVSTFSELRNHHGSEIKFLPRIIELEQRAEQLRITASQVLDTPADLSIDSPEGMIMLGRVTAVSNQLFDDTQQLINDVTIYSGQMRDEIFNYMLTMGMVIFCVGILFLIMLYRGVMGPLKLLDEMRNLIRRVRTEGDLSAKLQSDEGNTEVGRLATDFNALISSLNCNLGKTSQTVSLVAEHVERLSQEVRESHDEISAQQHEIFHLNNSIRKMAETLQLLSGNANKLARSAEELGEYCVEGVGAACDKREHAACPDSMIRQLSDSIGDRTHKLLQTIETEQEVLHTINHDVDKIASLENHAAFTSNLITSASDELLYLSKLLSSEVQRFHTTLEQEEETQLAS